MTAALEIWSSQYGDLPLFKNPAEGPKPKAAPQRPRINLKYGYAYPALIREAKVCVSTFANDVQIEIDFEVQDVHKHKIWLTLPMQESDMGKDKDLVGRITVRRMNDLQRVYQAACPYDYALYDEVKQNDEMKNVYFDFQGDVMTEAKFTERRKFIEASMRKLVAELHDSVGRTVKEILGAQLYIVLVENKRNVKYPYTNIFMKPPRKYPLHNPDNASRNYDSAPF